MIVECWCQEICTRFKDQTFLFTYRAFHIKFLRFIPNLHDHQTITMALLWSALYNFISQRYGNIQSKNDKKG